MNGLKTFNDNQSHLVPDGERYTTRIDSGQRARSGAGRAHAL
jgi:hypothetical protein